MKVNRNRLQNVIEINDNVKPRLFPGDLVVLRIPSIGRVGQCEEWLKEGSMYLVVACITSTFVSSGTDWRHIHIMNDKGIFVVPDRCCSMIGRN